MVLYYASVKNHQSNCRHVLIQYVRQKDMNCLHSSSLICSNLEQISEERMNIQLLFKSRIEVI